MITFIDMIIFYIIFCQNNLHWIISSLKKDTLFLELLEHILLKDPSKGEPAVSLSTMVERADLRLSTVIESQP